MGSPTPPEVSLQIEVNQLRGRIAALEKQLQAAQEERGRMLADLGDAKPQAEQMDAGDQSPIQQNRLRAVLDALPVGVALLDGHGGMIESNAAFERIWGGPRPATGRWKTMRATKPGGRIAGNPSSLKIGLRRTLFRRGKPSLIRRCRSSGSTAPVLLF